jgi:prepilin-type N-terminal cleavage/methylation domain-containing protein
MKRGFTLVELLVVIVIIAILASLLLVGMTQMLCRGRAAAAEARVVQLHQAVAVYALEQGTFPPDLPTFESSSLYAALQSMSSKKVPYFWVDPSELDGAGNLRNPVRPQTEIIRYRDNSRTWPPGDPAAHNKATYDLWAMDCAGIPDRLNNWGGP